MRQPALVCLLLAGFSSVVAADVDKAADIITKDGELFISDGSSYYRFGKDGSFESGPLGMSGRTVQGKWKADGAYMFVIEGDWGWVNGVSAKNDHRRLSLSLQPPFTAVPAAAVPPLLPHKGKTAAKLYTCYFVIDELVKLAPAK